MTEKTQYPFGRDFCAYRKFIEAAKKDGRRYGFGRDKETGAMGLFVAVPILLPSGRRSKRKTFAGLMRSTGPMTAAAEIVWKS